MEVNPTFIAEYSLLRNNGQNQLLIIYIYISLTYAIAAPMAQSLYLKIAMEAHMIILMILTSVFMLLIWSLCLINKKQEPRPSYQSMEEKRWQMERCVNEWNQATSISILTVNRKTRLTMMKNW